MSESASMRTSGTQVRTATPTRDTSLRWLLIRGGAGGMVAGMVFAGMTMWLMAVTGVPVKLPLLAIASIVQGEGAMGEASPVLGVVIHLGLSAAFGMGLALLCRRLRLPTDGAVVAAGLGFGLALYLVNFVVLGNAIFDVFTRLNQPFQVLNHAMYGVLVALALVAWRTRSDSAVP